MVTMSDPTPGMAAGEHLLTVPDVRKIAHPMTPELGGVAEIAAELDVPRTTVSMWASRRRTSGFPEPISMLSMGPVYSMAAVRDWYEKRQEPAS